MLRAIRGGFRPNKVVALLCLGPEADTASIRQDGSGGCDNVHLPEFLLSGAARWGGGCRKGPVYTRIVPGRLRVQFP